MRWHKKRKINLNIKGFNVRDFFYAKKIFPDKKEEWERKLLIEMDAEEYAKINLKYFNKTRRFFYKIKYFLIWAFKLLMPDFLVGHPNLWDNLKILKKHPQFKPLRTAVAVWMIFSLLAGSTGFYTLVNSPKVKASGEFSMKTGYYLGTGASLSITGLGFQPEMVFIKSETTAGALIWKTSVMPSDVTTAIGVASADNTETEITLDADGFTVSADLEVNTINVRYIFIAFAGSDCTATGYMCIGSYVGNGSTTQAITSVGFQPNLVISKTSLAASGMFRTSSMSDNHAAYFSATANNTTGVFFTTLDATGFTVGLTNNTNQRTFYYVAFRNLASKMAVGTFTGNGVDNRDITGVGFEPDFVMVKQNSTGTPALSTTEIWGDYAAYSTAAASIVDMIQSLDADGFQVGTNAAVNANTVTSHWFAFAGAPDPAPTPGENFLMQRGSYAGTGIAQSIDLSFAPDLVIIKSHSTQYAIFSTSLQNNISFYFSSSAVGFANAITAMGASSFTVGTDNTVNESGITFEYVAFGNATSPLKGAHADNFFIGAHTGNEINGRIIDHLGIEADMIAFKKINYGTTSLAQWISSSMAANATSYFSATADVTDGTAIKQINADGFTLGAGIAANDAAYSHVWFGFKEGDDFDVGSYSGTGIIQNITTSINSTPDFVWTKRSTAVNAVHKSSSATIAEGGSQHFLNLVNDTGDITGFVADGFSLGISAEVNTSGAGNTYYYVAWDALTSSNAPSTPSNSSPANGATAQDLNATLTGSVYADADDPDDAQTNAQWQVDDDSDFATPVWTRTAGVAEATTAITAANGTFANELSGKTELNHNATYYWRVRHSDGAYSYWSTATSFTTNIITTPTNSSPASGATATTLTPTLTASAFSDAQGGHSALNAQWQINSSNSFSSPLYDSGSVAYGASYAVPGATLSDRSTYYWRVRYQDSNSQWSEYSTATSFFVSESKVTVEPLFGSTVVDQGDSVKIDAQVKLADGTVINDATVTINIYNPGGTKIVTAGSMSYVTDSSGIYRYSYTVPAVSGSYLYEVTAVSDGETGYGAGNFEARTIAANITSISSTVGTIDTNVDTANSSLTTISSTLAEANAQTKAGILNTETTVKSGNTIIIRYRAESGLTGDGAPKIYVYDGSNSIRISAADMIEMASSGIYNYSLVHNTEWGTGYYTIVVSETTNDTNGSMSLYIGSYDMQSVGSAVNTISSNMDILIGAFIVTQSAVNDESASTTSFDTDLVNSTNDFYKNSVLTFTSGTLNGQSRRISAYNGSTNIITLDPALTSAPANNDTFTIVKQNVRVEEQAADIQTDVAAVQSDVTYIKGKVDDIYTLLGTVDTNLSSAQSSINQIRTSQQKPYKAVLSNTSQVQTGSTYRAKLTLLNYEDEPVNAAATPTITVYDSLRATKDENHEMTWLSTGTYEYTYDIISTSETGTWEAIITTAVGSSSNQTLNDYFDVTGSPAQVTITSVSETIPNISAVVKIANEGLGDSEYHYEWCVVSDQENQCGGNDDVDYGSDSKLIATGQNYTPTLDVTVPSAGTYWFKLVVYYGTESSGASRQFTATTASSAVENISSVGGMAAPVATIDTLSTELKSVKKTIEAQSVQLAKALDALGIIKPIIVSTGGGKLDNVKDVQNKLADLQAISSSIKQIVEQNSTTPVVETYMKFNSVEISFLITNPSSSAQTVNFKSFLPEEVKSENIVKLDGLKLEYDANANSYFVSGSISLGGKQSISKTVEIKDIWLFDENELASIKKQAESFNDAVKNTQYGAQGILLKNNIDDLISRVEISQKQSYTSPQDHILTYRNNKIFAQRAQSDLDKLKDLVVQSGASQGLLGKIGGIQTFATWGIILAIIFGFGLMGVVIFSMWRYQVVLASQVIESNRQVLSGINGKKKEV